MAQFTVTMPKLSPTMEKGTIAKWFKKEGDFVKGGDLLLEVATDKATIEHQALDDGYLRKIVFVEGSEASVGEIIAYFTEKKDEPFEVSTLSPKVIEQKASLSKEKKIPITTHSGERIRVSPLAKKLAEEKGIDLSKIQGSGPLGRIVLKDIEQGEVSSESGSFIELSRYQIAAAKRLLRAKQEIPHFYLSMEIDATSLIHFRDDLKELHEGITFNDCVLRGVSLALLKHPEIMIGFDIKKERAIKFSSQDISFAVSIKDGLITPIITGIDRLSLYEISQKAKELISKAKEGKLLPHEYEGGCFTVSNLGMFGVSQFQAIINPPQAAILAVGGVRERLKFGPQKEVISYQELILTLSCDHRVIDGVAGAKFLQTVKSYLESPLSLVV